MKPTTLKVQGLAAMILAAGRGTRLRPLSDERSKPSIPVVNRPLAWFAMDHLARSRVHRVVINAHHLGQLQESLLTPWVPHGLDCAFLQEPKLLGTAGGLSNASGALLVDRGPVLVMNGDTIFAPDFAAAIECHLRLDAIATMIVRPHPEAEAYGAVDVDAQGQVTGLLAKSPPKEGTRRFMFSGAHVLSPRAFEGLATRGCIVRKGYLRWLASGERIGAIVDLSPWREVGTISAYMAVNLDFVEGRFQWPGLEIETHRHAVVAPDADVSPSASVHASVVGPGARIGPHVRVTNSIIWDRARVFESVDSAVVTPTQSCSVRRESVSR